MSESTSGVHPLAAEVVAELAASGSTIAVAESLTGGLVLAALVSVPGASAVLNGGVVAYRSEVKHSLLGVSGEVLSQHGAVHPDVAMQMAASVRHLLAVETVPASVGVGTTGVAGPDPQDGHPPGTAFVGIAVNDDVRFLSLSLSGSRADIRDAVVSESLAGLLRRLRER